MADHYYTENPEAAHEFRTVTCELKGETLILKTDAGVFSKEHLDPGSRLLAESVPVQKGRILDLGCGYGPIGIAFAKAEPECCVVMSDVNRRSLELAQENLRQNEAANAQTVFSDGCEQLEGTFDLILSNPPIRIGKQALQKMWADCHARLNEGGSLYIVIRKKQGAPSAKQYLATLFGNCETVERQGGYHVLRAVRSKGEI